MPTLECRVAKIEEKVEMIQESIHERRRQSDKTNEMLEEIMGKINRMQGFSAGVATVFGMLGAAASFLWDKLTNH